MTTAQSASSIQPAPLPGWEKFLLGVNLAALLTVALLMRVYKLDSVPGLNGDEAWYGSTTLDLLSGERTSWTTPTGNLLNVFYFAPHLLLHSLLPPSITLLRLPALLSGLVALAANYVLCQRFFDRRSAIVSTWILALLPVDIAYSRFGWDASQTLLAATLVTYSCIHLLRTGTQSGGWKWAAAALCIAVLVHPTNVFLIPLFAAPVLCALRPQLARLDLRQHRWQAITAGIALLGAGALMSIFAQHWLQRGVMRLTQPGDLAAFSAHFARLFSGVTIYRYLSGAALEGSWYDALGIATVAMLTVLVLWRAVENRDSLETKLLLGLLLSMAAFFLIGGPAAIAPGYERYALFLIAPCVLLASRACVDLTYRFRFATLPMLTAGWIVLIVFQTQYFDFIAKTGGEAHAAFRTGRLDPKLAAAAEILSARQSEEPLWIVTSDWWSRQPLEYLTHGQRDVHVASLEEAQASEEFRQALKEGRAWFVELIDSPQHVAAKNYLRRQANNLPRSVTRDNAGRPVLSIWGGRGEKNPPTADDDFQASIR